MTATMSIAVDPVIRRLIFQTAAELSAAELDEALEDIATRIVQHANLLTETELVEGSNGIVRVRLRPFAELVLREAQAIARSTGNTSTKTARIRQMLVLAGYE